MLGKRLFPSLPKITSKRVFEGCHAASIAPALFIWEFELGEEHRPLRHFPCFEWDCKL